MKNIVFGLGRFNPPTRGHEEMILKIIFLAQQHKAGVKVFTTSSHDPDRNPLSIREKLAFLRLAFPGVSFAPTANAYSAAFNFNGFDLVILVAGSDRVPSYRNMITAGLMAGKLNFGKFHAVKLDRDADSNNENKSASATLARQFALDGELEKFIEIAPTRLSDEHKEQLYLAVRKGMGL